MRLTPELVARCFRLVPEPEAALVPRLTEDELAAEADRLYAAAPSDALWIFAYGSLIWKPVFTPVQTVRARARGWHRSFCIELMTWRGTPEVPGLMMALARGGSCVGLAMRLDPATARADLLELVRREMPTPALLGNARWITVETGDETAGGSGSAAPGEAGQEHQPDARAAVDTGGRRAIRRHAALTFYADPVTEAVSHRLPLDIVARRLALACGYAGSCIEYLHNTVEHLEAAGIRDRNLWQLQQLAAAEIMSWPHDPT